jgi:hypothetical protein
MKEFGLYMIGLVCILALAALYVFVINPMVCAPAGGG